MQKATAEAQSALSSSRAGLLNGGAINLAGLEAVFQQVQFSQLSKQSACAAKQAGRLQGYLQADGASGKLIEACRGIAAG